MPRSLQFTREGKWYIGVLFLVGIAAINTGNNLLYLIVATLLSFIVISGVMSESTLRGLSVSRVLPRHFYKNSQTNIRYRITNHKRFLSSFSFVVKGAGGAGGVRGAGDAGVETEPVYVLKLRPGAEDRRVSRHVFKRRGRHVLAGLKVTTRFPFGLFLKGKEEELVDEVVIYPDVRLREGAAVEPLYRGSGVEASKVRGGGTQIYNLRDYRAQDDSRLIYWKSAARTSKLLVKEFERESERKVLVVFENYCGTDGDVFEALVDEAAGLINYYMRKGYAVGLKTLSGEIHPRQGGVHLHRMLETLALIEPSDRSGAPGIKVIYV